MISGKANVYQVFEHIEFMEQIMCFDKENIVIVIFGLEEEPEEPVKMGKT